MAFVFFRDKGAAPGEDNKIDAAAAAASEAAPVGAAKKGGESTGGGGGGGDGDGDGNSGAEIVSSESRTVQLSKRVQAEGEMAGSRAQRMAELNSELKRQAADLLRGGRGGGDLFRPPGCVLLQIARRVIFRVTLEAIETNCNTIPAT